MKSARGSSRTVAAPSGPSKEIRDKSSIRDVRAVESRLRAGARGRRRRLSCRGPAARAGAASSPGADDRAQVGQKPGAPGPHVPGIAPARSDLCEARPVPGDAAGHRRRGHGRRTGRAAGQGSALSASAGRRRNRDDPRPANRRVVPRPRRGGGRRFDRAGLQGAGPRPRRQRTFCGGQGDPAGHPRPFPQ